MKVRLTPIIAGAIMVATLGLITASAAAVEDYESGINYGTLWYSGYTGAYSQYYTTQGTHFAYADVRYGSLVIASDRDASQANYWANADTGLQTPVDTATFNHGMGT